MDVMREGTELVFLYQLVDGNVVSSYGAYAAVLAGIPESIIQRGYEVGVLVVV